MSLTSIPGAQALMNPELLNRVLNEVRGLTISVVDGAAAGTAMPVPKIKPEDTIKAAVVLGDTWAAPTDDTPNITIQGVRANGTLTVNSLPADGDTFVVGKSVYTFKTTPTAANHVKIATTTTLQALNIANTINAYEGRYESQLNGDGYRTAGVTATATGTAVTITANTDGAGNNLALTGTASVLVAAGNGTQQGTLTAATVVAGNTFVVNGKTFTASANPTADSDFAVKGTNADQAAEIARVINGYEIKYGTLGVKATAAAAVVTIANSQPATGNGIALTENSAGLTVTGSGTLTGGASTGSIKSTTNLATATLLLIWFDKNA